MPTPTLAPSPGPEGIHRETSSWPARRASRLSLRVFGSMARGEDGSDSDVDLLVNLPPHMGLLGSGRVQADLEAILGTKVDLVPASNLEPAIQARAERDLVVL